MSEPRRQRSATKAGRAIEGSRRPGVVRRLFEGEEGTASIEAVIMIPFFIIVWGLLLFAVDVYKHKIDAGLRARDCGWAFAQTGCQTLPPQCAEEPGDPVAVDGGAGTGELESSLDELPIDIPIIGDVLNGVIDTLFGDLRVARHSASVQRPNVLGATTVQTRGAFAVMCNERPRTVGEMALDMVCSVAPFFCR